MLSYFLSYFPQIHEKIINMDINRASNNICHFISPCCVISEIIISKEIPALKRFLLENMAWVHSGTIPNRSRDQKCVIGKYKLSYGGMVEVRVPGML